MKFFHFKKWRGNPQAEPLMASGVNEFSSINNEKLHLFLALFSLLIITFYPLVFGKNFIPFEKYPHWSSILAESSGQQFKFESPALKRLTVLTPLAEDPEVGSIAMTWAENLYLARGLKRGQLFLWNPYTGGGVPTLDCGQSRPFNPLRLPFYFYSTTWMYSLTLFLGLVFGGFGAYFWFSRLGFSSAAITLGTGLFMFNPWVLDRLVLTDSAAYFFLPWCLLSLNQTIWKDWPSIARAVLCFVLMGHSGHPEVSLIMAGVATTVYLLSEINLRNCKESISKRFKIIGVVAAITCICLIVLWLPLMKLFYIGYLYKKSRWFVFEYHWKSLVALPSDMFIVPSIVALLMCVLFSWKRVPRIWVVLLVAVSFILFPLPWIGTLPSRFVSYIGLPSLYLKGVFWASLSFLTPACLDAYRALKKEVAIAVLAMGIAFLFLTIWVFAGLPMAKDDISAFPNTAFLLLALGLIALLFLRISKKKIASLLLSAIVLTPLVFPLSLNKLLWNTIEYKTNTVTEWLKANRPSERSVSISINFKHPLAIPPNLGQVYGVMCAELNAAIFLNNYWSMFHHPNLPATMIFFDSFSEEILNQVGASIVLLPNDISLPGLNLLIKGTRFSAYSIPRAHGRLYFTERTCHYTPNRTFPEQIQSINQNTDAVAVVESMGNPVPAVIPEIPHGKGKAVFVRDEIANVVVHTDCPLEGLLVLRDSWYPGWMASIDGKRVPILRINGCFRGVIVPIGRHVIKFVYRPLLLYVAGGISLVGSLLVLLVSTKKSSAVRKSLKGE